VRKTAGVLVFIASLCALLPSSHYRNGSSPGFARDHAHSVSADTTSRRPGAQIGHVARAALLSRLLSSSLATLGTSGDTTTDSEVAPHNMYPPHLDSLTRAVAAFASTTEAPKLISSNQDTAATPTTEPGPSPCRGGTDAAPLPTGCVVGIHWTLAAGLKVVYCEEGDSAQYHAGERWFWSGELYPDSLGIDARAWTQNGGTSDVSAAAQLAVASKIQTYPPDQSVDVGVSRAGCAPW